jgi:hypothetical protein
MVRPTSAGPFAPLHSNAESAVDRMHCTGYEARLRPGQPGDHARDFLKPSVALNRYKVMHQIFHRTVFGVGFGIDRPKLNDVDRDAGNCVQAPASRQQYPSSMQPISAEQR